MSALVKYNYNFEVPALKQNRFTEAGIVERIIQRFGDRMVVRGEALFVFNTTNHTWQEQSYVYSPLLYQFWSDVTQDVINDPRFINDLCRNNEGEVSADKMKRMEEKFMSVRLYNSVSKTILTSPDGIRNKKSSEFDDNNDLLFCENGVLNMMTGEFRDARPEDYLLNRSPVVWDENAKCDDWIDFLNEVFSLDADTEDIVRFMQELFGYTLSGDISEQKIFCHYGSGANGKSKVLSALKHIGGDYCSYVDPDDFTKIEGGFSKAFERFGSKIESKRIAIVDDLEVTSIWNESLVKAVTSPFYRARAEYEKSREVKNHVKLHLGLNVAPSPQAENYGILRRLCLIPYTRQFTPNSKASTVIDKMISDGAPGILAWAVEGYRRMKSQEGIKYPMSADLAIEEYQENHFVFEKMLLQMYERSKEEEFEFCFDIHNEVLKRCQREGVDKRIGNEELGLIIKRVFGVPSIKKWHPDKKNSYRGYPLKRKFETTPDSDVL